MTLHYRLLCIIDLFCTDHNTHMIKNKIIIYLFRCNTLRTKAVCLDKRSQKRFPTFRLQKFVPFLMDYSRTKKNTFVQFLQLPFQPSPFWTRPRHFGSKTFWDHFVAPTTWGPRKWGGGVLWISASFPRGKLNWQIIWL